MDSKGNFRNAETLERHTEVERWTAPLSEQPAQSGTRLLKIPSCLQQQNTELMNFYERSFGYYSNVWNTVKFAKSEFSGKPANPVHVWCQGQVTCTRCWRQHSSSDPQSLPPSKTHPQNVILQNCLKYYKISKESVSLSLPTRRKPAWIVINQINWHATMQLVGFTFPSTEMPRSDLQDSLLTTLFHSCF